MEHLLLCSWPFFTLRVRSLWCWLNFRVKRSIAQLTQTHVAGAAPKGCRVPKSWGWAQLAIRSRCVENWHVICVEKTTFWKIIEFQWRSSSSSHTISRVRRSLRPAGPPCMLFAAKSCAIEDWNSSRFIECFRDFFFAPISAVLVVLFHFGGRAATLPRTGRFPPLTCMYNFTAFKSNRPFSPRLPFSPKVHHSHAPYYSSTRVLLRPGSAPFWFWKCPGNTSTFWPGTTKPRGKSGISANAKAMKMLDGESKQINCERRYFLRSMQPRRQSLLFARGWLAWTRVGSARARQQGTHTRKEKERKKKKPKSQPHKR